MIGRRLSIQSKLAAGHRILMCPLVRHWPALVVALALILAAGCTREPRTSNSIMTVATSPGPFDAKHASYSVWGMRSQQEAEKPEVRTGRDSGILFPVDRSCACIRTKKETLTVTSTEVAVGDDIFQVFTNRKTLRETFRVDVGTRITFGSVKWWNYGVVTEGDFNGDGRPDYAWYGGDDTSDVKYVFLSYPTSYRRLNIRRSVERYWERRFPGRKLQYDDWSSDKVDKARIVKDSRGLRLEATVVYKERKYPVRLEEQDLVFSD